jgi:hypothetical protein
MKHARISTDNVVLEVFTPPEGFSIADCFTPELAAQFVPVPDQVEQNWIKNPDGSFSAPAPVIAPRTWTVSDVRPNLTLAERVKWDGDKTDFIKTAKIELAQPKNLADTTEVLETLVDAGDISQASMNKILA